MPEFTPFHPSSPSSTATHHWVTTNFQYSESEHHSSSSTVSVLLEGDSARAFQRALDSLPEPKSPLNLVSLARAEFPRIDRNHDGKIEAPELFATIPDTKLALNTRTAAAVLDRRLWGAGFLSITDDGPYITNTSLRKWNDAINLHNDHSLRDQLLRSYTGTGAGMGFSLGAVTSVLTLAFGGNVVGKLRWLAPLGITAVFTGIGALSGRASGENQLAQNERMYKDLL